MECVANTTENATEVVKKNFKFKSAVNGISVFLVVSEFQFLSIHLVQSIDILICKFSDALN
jgi:hypothetical protein